MATIDPDAEPRSAGPPSRDLKQRFIALFQQHPIIVILVVMVIGALLFGDLLT